jgi:putative ATP-binding cassette transporter
MQTTQAFQQVQDALSFFVQSYKEIAAWGAVVERLAGFERHSSAFASRPPGAVRRVREAARHLT